MLSAVSGAVSAYAPVAACCAETCTYASDGDCDDGGPGSEYQGYCTLGSDCTDCGSRCPPPAPPRSMPFPPYSPSQPPHPPPSRPNPPSPPLGPGRLFTFDYDSDDGLSQGWSVPSSTGSSPFPFTRQTGTTPSLNTGPSAGYGGAGAYYYAEASRPARTGDVFLLAYDGRVCTGETPMVDRVAFQYHMKGSGMGALALFAADNRMVWSVSGEQSADGRWQQAIVSGLGTPAVQFAAVRGASWASDIAVDNVDIRCGQTLPPSPPTPPSSPHPPAVPPSPPLCQGVFDLVLVLDRSGGCTGMGVGVGGGMRLGLGVCVGTGLGMGHGHGACASGTGRGWGCDAACAQRARGCELLTLPNCCRSQAPWQRRWRVSRASPRISSTSSTCSWLGPQSSPSTALPRRSPV